MSRLKSRQSLYTDKSGQMAVMAEFLIRGYNVAVPEVDVGEDIFVVKDKDGNLSRIQVKSATARELRNGGFTATFNLPLRQLEAPHIPEMNYILVSADRFSSNRDEARLAEALREAGSLAG